MTFVFQPPLVLDSSREWEVAVSGGMLTNSLANVSPKLNNNSFRYSVDGGSTFKTIILPSGSYQTTALQTELQRNMKINGDYTVVNGTEVYPITFSANIYLLRFQVSVTGNNVQVDLSSGELYKLLGFSTPRILSTVNAGGETFVAENTAQFTTSSDFLYINTDIIKYGINVGNGNLTIGGIIKTVESNGLGVAVSLQTVSGNYIYFPLRESIIRSINIRVLDAFGRQADLRGESVTCQFSFRSV